MDLELSHSKSSYYLGCCRVETCYIQHTSILRISQRKLVGGHSTDNQSSINTHGLAIVLQSFRWVDLPRPCLIIRVHNEHVHFEIFLLGMDHWLSAVSGAHGDLWGTSTLINLSKGYCTKNQLIGT